MCEGTCLSLTTHSSSVLGKLVEINFWFILYMDVFVIFFKVNVNCFDLGLLCQLVKESYLRRLWKDASPSEGYPTVLMLTDGSQWENDNTMCNCSYVSW